MTYEALISIWSSSTSLLVDPLYEDDNTCTKKKRKLSFKVWEDLKPPERDDTIHNYFQRCITTFKMSSSTGILLNYLNTRENLMEEILNKQYCLDQHVGLSAIVGTPEEDIQHRLERSLCERVVSFQAPFSVVKNEATN